MKRYPILDLLSKQYPEYAREKLSAFLACRNVLVDGVICGDGKAKFPQDAHLSFTFEKYVSRGGYKLEKALDAFHLSVEGKVVLDAGSSTGGFTDCLLQHGARIVHAVDVGTNQLDWRLRKDSRVIVHEKQNIMTLGKEGLEPPPAAAVCDLSFRSISGAASHILSLSGETWLISLIKPQFEVPKGLEGFDGIIRDDGLLHSVMLDVYQSLALEGVGVEDIVRSPITGHKGNTEFLALLSHRKGLDEPSFSERCR
jgi:23S rRNA (cytidine1920-2'-O)/16S rRNA (cytidine1409-2'-O)-methyltransferase